MSSSSKAGSKGNKPAPKLTVAKSDATTPVKTQPAKGANKAPAAKVPATKTTAKKGTKAVTNGKPVATAPKGRPASASAPKTTGVKRQRTPVDLAKKEENKALKHAQTLEELAEGFGVSVDDYTNNLELAIPIYNKLKSRTQLSRFIADETPVEEMGLGFKKFLSVIIAAIDFISSAKFGKGYKTLSKEAKEAKKANANAKPKVLKAANKQANLKKAQLAAANGKNEVTDNNMDEEVKYYDAEGNETERFDADGNEYQVYTKDENGDLVEVVPGSSEEDVSSEQNVEEDDTTQYYTAEGEEISRFNDDGSENSPIYTANEKGELELFESSSSSSSVEEDDEPADDSTGQEEEPQEEEVQAPPAKKAKSTPAKKPATKSTPRK
jgi:YD repeat-containing protein